jgi:uncharacterized protein YkwD
MLAVTGGMHGEERNAPAKEPLIKIEFVPLVANSAVPENFTLEELNAALLVETNRVRVAHDLRPLRALPALIRAADDQSAFMALTFRVAHANPIHGQRDVVERAKRHGLASASYLAENVLSSGLAPSSDPPLSCAQVAAQLVEQWMNSPGHRANLLNRDFTDLGCAARRVKFIGGTEGFFATQVFAAR